MKSTRDQIQLFVPLTAGLYQCSGWNRFDLVTFQLICGFGCWWLDWWFLVDLSLTNDKERAAFFRYLDINIQLKIFTGSEKSLRRKTYLPPKNHPKSISKGNLLDNWWQTKAINTWMARSNLYVALLSTSTSFFLHSLSFLFAAQSALSLRSSCIWSGSKSSRSSGLCICNLHSIKKSKPLHLQSINAQMHGVHCT